MEMARAQKKLRPRPLISLRRTSYAPQKLHGCPIFSQPKISGFYFDSITLSLVI